MAREVLPIRIRTVIGTAMQGAGAPAWIPCCGDPSGRVLKTGAGWVSGDVFERAERNEGGCTLSDIFESVDAAYW
jgi:hypothetical protein